jgi:hypothetical protein
MGLGVDVLYGYQQRSGLMFEISELCGVRPMGQQELSGVFLPVKQQPPSGALLSTPQQWVS